MVLRLVVASSDVDGASGKWIGLALELEVSANEIGAMLEVPLGLQVAADVCGSLQMDVVVSEFDIKSLVLVTLLSGKRISKVLVDILLGYVVAPDRKPESRVVLCGDANG